MAKTEIIEIFKETEALLEGHFILTSGKHSPSYFQCAKLLQHPGYLSKFAKLIAQNFHILISMWLFLQLLVALS